MKTRGKLLIGLIVLVVAFFGINKLVGSGLVGKKAEADSVVLSSIALPEGSVGSGSNIAAPLLPEPSSTPAEKGTKVIWEVMAWNSQMAGMYANGGVRSTKGSAVSANGVDLTIVRQDDTSKMQADLLKNATDYKNDKKTPGLLVSIMGSGVPAFTQLNKQLEKVGTHLVIVPYSVGKSAGEDALWAPKEWLENPKAALGKTVACYLHDGDQDIVLKWASDNGLKINPDPTTHDDEAVNFLAASDFVVAGDKYINGTTESVTKVIKGKNTGVKIDVKADAVATWTPADVNIAKKKGGLVKIVSTKDYSNQMPNIMLTTADWYNDHQKEIEGLITAFAVAADQVKGHPEALKRAGEISSEVYGDKDKDGAYWVKYYKGVVEPDLNGVPVELGGSKVYNFSDNLGLFGLNPGSTNIYASVYKAFGDVQHKLYPIDVPDYTPLNQMLDLTILKRLQDKYKGKSMVKADVAKFRSDEDIKVNVSKKAYSIEFNSGQSTFTDAAQEELDDLFDGLVVAGNLKVAVHGYTDNSGSPQSNLELSQDRANAIKMYLENKSEVAFPEGRIVTYAHGEGDPVASNTTPVGKAKNRRVVIIQGN